MSFPIPTERTPETNDFYERKYTQLANQVAKQLGHQKGTLVAPMLVANHLINRRRHLSKRTWQVYKSACVAQFRRISAAHPGDAAIQQEFNHAAETLSQESQQEALSRGTKGASLKQKKVDEADHVKLMDWLKSQPTDPEPIGRMVATWCESTLIAGLRPIEWARAELLTLPTGARLLQVANAKNTQGRANGEFRHLDISDCSPEEMGVVEDMIALAGQFAQSEDGFTEHQKRLSKFLHRAVRKLFPRRRQHYTLYSYRHQFAADKKRQWGQAEVAALMGHGSDRTAGMNYARATSGRGSSAVKPLRAEVDQVRRTAKSRPAPKRT